MQPPAPPADELSSESRRRRARRQVAGVVISRMDMITERYRRRLKGSSLLGCSEALRGRKVSSSSQKGMICGCSATFPVRDVELFDFAQVMHAAVHSRSCAPSDLATDRQASGAAWSECIAADATVINRSSDSIW